MPVCRHQLQEWGHYPEPGETGYVIWWVRCPTCGGYKYERRVASDPYAGRPVL